MAVDCIARAAKELEDLGLEKKRIDQYIKNMDAFIKKYGKQADFQQLLDKKIKDVRNNVLKQRDHASRDAKRLFDINKIVGDMGAKPMKAAEAIFERSTKAGLAARHSIDNLFSTLHTQGLDNLYFGLKSKKLLGFVDGKSDVLIADAMWKMGRGVALTNVRKEIQEVAEVLMKGNDWVVQTLRNAGVDVGEIPGYIMRQTHDPVKVRSAGFEKWATFVQDKLDYIQMRKVDGRFEVDTAILRDIFDEMVSTSGNRHLTKDFSKSRSLFFKDSGKFMEYHAEYGYSKNLYESIQEAIKSASRKTAIVSKLTTKPSMGVEYLKKAILKADPNANLGAIDNMYSMVLGADEAAATTVSGKILQNHRNFLTAVNLWGTIKPALMDWSSAALAFKTLSGESYPITFAKNMAAYTNALVRPGFREEMGRVLALNMELQHAIVSSRLTGGEFGKGNWAKFFKAQFRLNFVGPHTRAGKVAMGGRFKALLEEAVKAKKFTTEQVNLFRDFNFDTVDVAFLRELKEITPDTIMAVDLKKVPRVMGEAQARTPAQFKQDLMMKFLNYVNDTAEMSIPTPGKKEFRQFGRYVSPDTNQGQILRSVAQYKYTPMKQFNTVKYLGSHYRKNGNSAMSTAWFLGYTGAFATMSAFAMYYMEDVWKGKEPRELNPINFIDAMARSGHFGLINDYIMGEYSMWNPASSSAIGPQPSQALYLMDWLKDAAREGDQKMGDRAMNSIIYNTPGLGHPFMFHIRQGLLDAMKDLSDNDNSF